MMNARVFPLPVFAAPRISLPLSARGTARAWTSVGTWKCEAASPAAVGSETGRSVKFLMSALRSCSDLSEGKSLGTSAEAPHLPIPQRGLQEPLDHLDLFFAFADELLSYSASMAWGRAHHFVRLGPLLPRDAGD